jgi:cell wall-associated NlpC family hydrolase
MLAVALAVAMLSAVPALAAPASTTTSASAAASGTDLPVSVDGKTQAFRDQLKTRQAKLEALKAQLVELDTEAEIAGEAYNQAFDHLNVLRSELATTQADLAKAKAAYQVQADLLAGRAADLYREGGSQTALDVVLSSKSIPDFIERLQFLGVIGQADADLALQLQNQRDTIQKNAENLDLQRQQAEALEFDLAARKREIELRIADRQAMLANTQQDLLSMLDSEAVRRQADETALYQSILNGVKDKGITVEPGGPVETALAYHGVPYLWGGATPAGFDCSGLVMYVYAQHGVTLPHYSGAQFLQGAKVEYSQLLPGDLVFFGSPIHHVGMYIGGGYFIEAPHTGDFVKISKLAGRSNFAGARRYAWTTRIGQPAGLAQLSPNVDHSRGLQGIYGGVR